MRKLLYLSLFIFTSFTVFSQEAFSVNYKQSPLKEVLIDLENKTSLLFSYSEEVIKNKTISLVNTSITEKQLLKELNKQTKLNFDKIAASQVLISAPSTKINICGHLFDAKTKETLAFTNVLIKDTYRGVLSDENGYFEISNVNNDAIVFIQQIGFEKKYLKASSLTTKNCKHIFLISKDYELETVLITSYLTRGISKNTDGSISLKNDELSILPGLVEPDVFQSIQMIPGISSLDESVSDIQIRGGSSDQNLIYFDGIKLYNTGHFFGMISNINPYIVKNTKIYKGGASPEYGDRISGVIDISSDKDVPNTTTGGIGVNGTHGDAFVKTPLSKNVGLILSARRSYTDVFQTPTFDALSEKVFQNTKITTNSQATGQDDDDDIIENIGKEDFFFYDGNAKVIIQPSKNDNIAISGLITKNDLDFTVTDDDDLISDKLIVKNEGASLLWQGTKFNKLNHSLKAYYSKFDGDYNNIITDDLVIEEENVRKNTVEDYGVDFNLTYPFNSTHAIKAGYQYSNTDVFFQLFRDQIEIDDDLPENTRDFNIERKSTNKANTLYSEYIYKTKNRGFISLGIRGSHYSLVNNFFIEPRLNVEYPISKILRLKATVEKRYQPISQLIEFEDTQLRLENNIWTLSNNRDIPILSSLQYSAGILINVKGWTLDVDTYMKKIDGLTSFTNGFTNVSDEISIGKSNITGLDFMLRKKIGLYRIWLGYTFNDVEYSFEKLQSTPFRGNNDITHNFRISNTFELNKWQLSLGWMYRTGSPFTPIESFNSSTGDISFGLINSQRLPNYHRLDASILYELFSTENNFKGTFGIALQNIYSRQIPILVSYHIDNNLDTGLDELNQVQQLSLGFTPNATFRLYF